MTHRPKPQMNKPSRSSQATPAIPGSSQAAESSSNSNKEPEEKEATVKSQDMDDQVATRFIFNPSTTPRVTPTVSFISTRYLHRRNSSAAVNRELPENRLIAMVFSNAYLDSPTSVNLGRSEPLSLFLQALARVEENDVNMRVLEELFRRWNTSGNLGSDYYSPGNTLKTAFSGEVPAPESLLSAPPSYSFVLRQIAARRRTRLIGNFVSSPSFIQRTPPPNYTAAYDIYFDNPLPIRPSRMVPFTFMSTTVICPECGYSGFTVTRCKITICTHLCACILCMFCCLPCVPLPYLLRSCKDVYHYCRNCRAYLGMYCPTTTDPAFYHVP